MGRRTAAGRRGKGGLGGKGCARGFTYIALLIAVAVIAGGLAAVATVWHTFNQREQEKHLLFVGNEFRVALNRFYAANQRYPNRLEELVQDETKIVPVRHLRQIYFDPLTGARDWGTVRLQNGQIVGVYSQSGRTPVKTAGFLARDASFKDSTRYSEWVFVAAGQTAVPGAAAAAPPTPPLVPAPAPVRAPSRFR